MKINLKRQMSLLLFLVTLLIGSAKAVDVGGELKRGRDNTARLARMHPAMQPKVRAVLSDLEAHGYRPLIDGQVHRTPAQQAALVRKGHSKTYYSFHNVTGKNGRAESLAADITDARWAWQSGHVFWLKLSASAYSHNLGTGIDWGLSTTQRERLREAIRRRNFKYRGALGWDTAHVQVKGITLPQARRGVRPR